MYIQIPADMLIDIPITMAAAFSTGSAIVAPLPGYSAICSLKANFLDLIHQSDIQVQENPIESTQAYINIGKHFQEHLQMIPEMSENDFEILGLGQSIFVSTCK